MRKISQIDHLIFYLELEVATALLQETMNIQQDLNAVLCYIQHGVRKFLIPHSQTKYFLGDDRKILMAIPALNINEARFYWRLLS